MSQPLGKVTKDLDIPRGPDVTLRVTVDRTWFGRSVEVFLPRNVHCAACDGGGCDRCARAGALSLWKKDEPPRHVRVTLPALLETGVDVCLRVPHEGAPAGEPELERGHLMLTLRPGDASDDSVRLLSLAMSAEARQQLMKRSLIMAVCLILLFFGMLKLSGWL